MRAHIVQLRHSDLAPAVRRGTVDLAIARWVPSAPDLVQTQIGEDGVVVLIRRPEPPRPAVAAAIAGLPGL